MILRRTSRFLVVLAVGALLGAPSAGPVTEQLRRSVDRATAILADPSLRGAAMTVPRRTALRRVMDEAIDFQEAARRALGVHWQSRTDAERTEFIALFKELVEYAYILRVEPYEAETVVYAGESVERDQATVRTRIQTKQGHEIPIDYRLQRHGDHWLIYDVTVEGVSLVANYRTQFNTIIQTSSYAELVTRIRTRLRELAAPAPTAAR